MQTRLAIFSIFVMFILAACSQNKDENKAGQDVAAGNHKVVVEDVLQAESYTYLNVSENGSTFWIAVTKAGFQKGQTLYYVGGLEMRNFESKSLGKTFDVVYFVDHITSQPGGTAPSAAAPGASMQSPHGKAVTGKDADISVTPAKDGITIAELFSNRKKYEGKTVTIRGKIVKANMAIMGRNWVHIQDGTSSGDSYDLTVTTNESVNVGDVVTFQGVIALDKDFTAGYAYDVIMEGATRKVEQSS